MTEKTAVEILMVDDDDLDYELLIRQLKKQKIANPVHHVLDGVEALAFLRAWHNDKSLEEPKSLIVLLDINMPRMGGLECLREIRNDPALKSTTVFILTTSKQDEDILGAYELNVAGYLVKNELGPAFLEGVLMLDTYWRVVELPQF